MFRHVASPALRWVSLFPMATDTIRQTSDFRNASHFRLTSFHRSFTRLCFVGKLFQYKEQLRQIYQNLHKQTEIWVSHSLWILRDTCQVSIDSANDQNVTTSAININQIALVPVDLTVHCTESSAVIAALRHVSTWIWWGHFIQRSWRQLSWNHWSQQLIRLKGYANVVAEAISHNVTQLENKQAN